MRAEQAIEVLDKLFTCLSSYRCEHDECRNCSLSSPINIKRNALDRAIEALEREIPVSTGIAVSCSNCGGAVEKQWDYCPWCGQRRSKQ